MVGAFFVWMMRFLGWKFRDWSFFRLNVFFINEGYKKEDYQLGCISVGFPTFFPRFYWPIEWSGSPNSATLKIKRPPIPPKNNQQKKTHPSNNQLKINSKYPVSRTPNHHKKKISKKTPAKRKAKKRKKEIFQQKKTKREENPQLIGKKNPIKKSLNVLSITLIVGQFLCCNWIKVYHHKNITFNRMKSDLFFPILFYFFGDF
jgi:hypothetical protein